MSIDKDDLAKEWNGNIEEANANTEAHANVNGNRKDDDDGGGGGGDGNGLYVFANGNGVVVDDPPVNIMDLSGESQPLVLDVKEIGDGVGDSEADQNEVREGKSCANDGNAASASDSASSESEHAKQGVGKLNGMLSVTDSEAHCHVNDGEDHGKLDSTNYTQSTQDSRLYVSQAVECEHELLPANVWRANGSEEDSMEPVAKLEETVVSKSAADHEPNESSNCVDKVDGESDLGSVSNTMNQDLLVAETPDSVHNDADFHQEKEVGEMTNDIPVEGPQRSAAVDLGQNMQMASCPITVDVKMQEVEAVDPTASNAHGDSLPSGHAQDSVTETFLVDDLAAANQNIPEQNNFPGKAQILTIFDAGKDKNYASARNDDASGDPTDGIFEAEAQLKGEIVNCHITHEEGQSLNSGHAQESASCTSHVNGPIQDCQNTSEQGGPSEITKVLTSTVIHRSVPTESDESYPVAAFSGTVTEPDIGTEESQIVGANMHHNTAMKPGIKTFAVSDTESTGTNPVDDTKVEVGDNNSHAVSDITNCLAYNGKLEAETGSVFLVSEEKVSASLAGGTGIGFEALNDTPENAASIVISGDCPDEEISMCDSVENKGNLPCLVDVKAESNIENASVTFSGLLVKSEASNVSVLTNARTVNCIEDNMHAEIGEEQFVVINGDKTLCKGAEGIDQVQRDQTSTSPREGYIVDASDGQNAASEVGKRLCFYMIRIPRYNDQNLKEQIKHGQSQVDEMTKNRDAIQAKVRMERAKRKEYGDIFDAALSEEKTAREMYREKCKELDAVKSIINRVNTALSVDDIDGRIHNIEYRIQHETLPLKEEKNFIREIKQLKQLREQLSSSMGSLNEVQQAMDQKGHAEEQMKSMKKEVESMKETIIKAEAATKDAKKMANDARDKLKQLQAEFSDADKMRQEAYERVRSLKKQYYEKNECFRKYMGDANVANDLALKGDKEELQRHCVNQVERVMELWNKSDAFRDEYVSCNVRSTVRRLQTLDGRSLGPDEEPPVAPPLAERGVKDNTVSLTLTMQVAKPVAPVEVEKKDDKSTAKFGGQKNQTATSTMPVKPALLGHGLETVSGRDDTEEARKPEHKRSKEEDELARQAEELRKEKEAAKLKEQRILDEKAKAKEAMERKKRYAEKAQARAALRAQKEAEEKEREREKRARKKEKRISVVEDINGTSKGESAPNPEPATEIKVSETREKPTVTKRPGRASQFTNQTKAKSIPLPHRNRGKRRIQRWMWTLLIALLVFALFFMGNGNFFSSSWLQRFAY